MNSFIKSSGRAGLWLVLLFFALQGTIFAQSISEAEQLSASGQFQSAEELYQKMLVDRPDDPQLILGYAYNLSWMGHQNRAIEQFKLALKMKADPLKTYLGLAHAYAWSGKYGMARSIFSTLEREYPDNFDVKKGLAYTYLWQGQYQTAARQFEQLIIDHGASYDLFLSKGLAHLNDKETASAEDAFQQALLLQPQSEEAQNYLQAAQRSTSAVEGHIWMGYSQIDADQNRWGLRNLQLSTQLGKRWRAMVKYDNSLAMDILNFARQNQNIPTVTAGAVHEWNKNWISELEYGVRFLDDQQVQQLISGGQVYFLPGNASLKVGGFVGFGQGIPTEGLAYLSLNLPLGKAFRLEPTYFLISPPNNASTEHRFQTRLGYTSPGGIELGLYGFFGRTTIGGDQEARELYGWSITALAPITHAFAAQLNIRREEGIFNDITSVAAGLRLRLQR